MFDEPVRRRFASAARPVVNGLARLGLSPNLLTSITFGVAIAGAALIATGRPRAGLVLWIVSRLGDGLDGALARATERQTLFGGYLDITLDMAAYSAMILAFAQLHPSLSMIWSAILAAYVIVITTTLALSDAAAGAARRVSQTDRTFQFTPAIAEAGETSVMYTLWVLLPEAVGWLAGLWLIALIGTCVQRSILAWRVLR